MNKSVRFVRFICDILYYNKIKNINKEVDCKKVFLSILIRVPFLIQKREIMAKEWSKTFYKSQAWQQCRNAYIAERTSIDGGMCEECRQQLGYIVHHKKKLTEDNISNPDISLNHKYLEYVCKSCHDEFEGHFTGHKKQEIIVIFDSNGQPISRKEPERT